MQVVGEEEELVTNVGKRVTCPGSVQVEEVETTSAGIADRFVKLSVRKS